MKAMSADEQGRARGQRAEPRRIAARQFRRATRR